MNISPELCLLKPDNIEINEVFPLPLGPTKAILLPFCISRLISFKISLSSFISEISLRKILSTLVITFSSLVILLFFLIICSISS